MGIDQRCILTRSSGKLGGLGETGTRSKKNEESEQWKNNCDGGDSKLGWALGGGGEGGGERKAKREAECL